ncbi:MAG: hypothetical protein GXO78_13735 [Calditrichaeota bacterium]|nr:hypothetical protein [Calditrichota bacterium]
MDAIDGNQPSSFESHHRESPGKAVIHINEFVISIPVKINRNDGLTGNTLSDVFLHFTLKRKTIIRFQRSMIDLNRTTAGEQPDTDQANHPSKRKQPEIKKWV